MVYLLYKFLKEIVVANADNIERCPKCGEELDMVQVLLGFVRCSSCNEMINIIDLTMDNSYEDIPQ